MKLGYIDKLFVKKAKKKKKRKHSGTFSPRYSQNYILNGKFNPRMYTIRAFFSKIWELFFDFQKNVSGGLAANSSVLT